MIARVDWEQGRPTTPKKSNGRRLLCVLNITQDDSTIVEIYYSHIGFVGTDAERETNTQEPA